MELESEPAPSLFFFFYFYFSSANIPDLGTQDVKFFTLIGQVLIAKRGT